MFNDKKIGLLKSVGERLIGLYDTIDVFVQENIDPLIDEPERERRKYVKIRVIGDTLLELVYKSEKEMFLSSKDITLIENVYSLGFSIIYNELKELEANTKIAIDTYNEGTRHGQRHESYTMNAAHYLVMITDLDTAIDNMEHELEGKSRIDFSTN